MLTAVRRFGAYVRELFSATLLAFALLLFLGTHVFGQGYVVVGTSMYPTLQNNEMILVDRVSYHLHAPQRGDIVIFQFPLDHTQTFVKRVIGVPGDVVSITNGLVSINGHRQTETYVKEAAYYNWGPQRVPKGTIFVLGDNRPVSYDSHAWLNTTGLPEPFVSDNLIDGRAMLGYWPLAQAGILSR